jgi:NADPH:quinone reductase
MTTADSIRAPMNPTIRAVVFHDFGDPDVLEVVELPQPAPGRGEVVIRVAAATVNPTDLMMRNGDQAALMTELTPPYITGMEFAGIVEAIGDGEDGEDGPKVGDAVIGVVNPRRPAGGAYTESVVVPVASVVPAPAGLDLMHAATIGMNGLTAVLALVELGGEPGDTVLVTGGAGALGGYCVQLAKDAGLVVIADAKPEDEELLRQLGADVILPRGDGLADAVREAAPDGVAGAIDSARVGESVATLVADGRVYVGVRSSDRVEDPRIDRRFVSVATQLTNTPALARLSTMAANGSLTTRVAATFAFDEAAQAHRLVARGGLRGRVVLVPGGFEGS